MLERQLALKDVAFRQSEFSLQVEWRQDLTIADDASDVWSVFRYRVDDCIAERLPLIVPRSSAESVGGVLHEARQDVLTRWSERRVGERRDHHVDVGSARELPVLCLVVGAFHIVHAGRDRERPSEMSSRARTTREIGQRIER